MATNKQYTVIVTSTEAQDLRTHKVAQHSGDRGRALRIKAKAGETYQLVELQPGQAHSYAPQNGFDRHLWLARAIVENHSGAMNVFVDELWSGVCVQLPVSGDEE